jgi:hypothetical protein
MGKFIAHASIPVELIEGANVALIAMLATHRLTS